MADIATIWDPHSGWGDWYRPANEPSVLRDETGAPLLDETSGSLADGLFIGSGDLLVGNDLGTAVLISLFTDRTASADDIITDGSADPRGWWGDLDADRPIGSKLWLRLRSKQNDLTLALAKNDIVEALQWLIDDGVARSVDVTTEWSAPGVLGATILITRTDGTAVGAGFDYAWQIGSWSAPPILAHGTVIYAGEEIIDDDLILTDADGAILTDN